MELNGNILIGIGKSILGAIYPPVKKYFDQPKVYLVLNFDNSSQRPTGLSSKNDSSAPILVTHAIYDYELRWEFFLILRNNSEFPAYNFKLIEPAPSINFQVYPKLDSLKPLNINEEIQYTVKFYETFTGTGSEVANVMKRGPLLLDKFILEYTNIKGVKFYTTYQHSKDELSRNEFVRKLQN